MTGECRIPFVRPFMGEDEVAAVARSLRSGRLAGDGPETRAAVEQLRALTGSRGILLTPSCTHALELALMALGIAPGDEVLSPSFAFVSSGNAAVLRGAACVFAEIRPDTLNLDPVDLERRVTDRTRAVIVVHYAGVAAPMDEILAVTRPRGIAVVEDAAQCIGSRYRGRHLGTIGDIGCFSFHETKNISCAEGGALVTEAQAIIERAEIIREKGTDRSAFFRGEVRKYMWQQPGSSYLLADPLAAILRVQLGRLPEIQERRRKVWRHYAEALSDLEREGRVRLPHIPEEAEPNWHIFYVLFPDGDGRDRVLRALRRRGIQATFHFVPLHTSPYAQRALGMREGDLPITERIASTLLRLPLYPQMTEEEQELVIKEFRRALDSPEE